MRCVQCDGGWSTCPSAVTALPAGLGGSWVGATERQRSALCNVCMVQNSRASPTNWEKEGGNSYILLKQPRWGKSQDLEMNTSAQMRGDVGSPHLSLLLLAFPALFHPSLSLAGSCRASQCCCDLSAGRGIRSVVHLDRPCSFSTGTWLELLCFSVWAWTSSAICQLASGPHPGPLSYSHSVSTLLFPSLFLFTFFFFSPFSPLSLIPLDYGKAVQIFQVYWTGKRLREHLFLLQQVLFQLSLAWKLLRRVMGFPASFTIPMAPGQHLCLHPFHREGEKKSGFELPNPNLYSLCWCVSLPQPRMEFIGYYLRANKCFIALAPLKEAEVFWRHLV